MITIGICWCRNSFYRSCFNNYRTLLSNRISIKKSEIVLQICEKSQAIAFCNWLKNFRRSLPILIVMYTPKRFHLPKSLKPLVRIDFSGRRETRTLTISRHILSVVRLPIPPLAHEWTISEYSTICAYFIKIALIPIRYHYFKSHRTYHLTKKSCLQRNKELLIQSTLLSFEK